MVMRVKKQTPQEKEARKEMWKNIDISLDETGKFLQENLTLILKNKQTILNTPKYFFSKLPLAFIFVGIGPWSEYTVSLPLGVLIKLWSDGTLIQQCEKCESGRSHIYHWFGNTIRPQYEKGYGHYHYLGVCDKCFEVNSVHKNGASDGQEPIEDFKRRCGIAKNVSQENENKEIAKIIDPGEPRRFSWSKGLTEGRPEIKKIIKPKTVPVDIDDLVKILKGEPVDLGYLSEVPEEKQRFQGKTVGFYFS
jgi:hypothetical protein